jgi:hypothetical protein
VPASRHFGSFLAGTVLVCLALAGGEARAQDREGGLGRSQTLNSGRRTAPPQSASTPTPDASSIRPGLAPSAADGEGPPALGAARAGSDATSGSTPRQGLRPPKARRSRPATQAPIRGDFRSTIAPPAVAVDVQPLQTGVPDPAVAAAPPRKRPAIDDPYAPLGLRVGNVVVTPIVGQYLGYDTNPNRLPANRKPSALSLTEVELGIQSDWSRHDLFGQLRGAYSEYFDNPAARRPEGQGNLRLRLDVTRDTEIEVEGHYLIDTQRPTSPDLNAPVVSRPVVYTEGASVAAVQRINRLLVTLRGTIDRYDYENARLPGGVILDQSDRAMTQYGLRGRLGYEVHPGLIPFVESFVDTRRYDRKVDSNGYERSSDGVGVRVGALVELSRLLTAEVSAGGTQRAYEDKRLGTLTSPIADASLVYAMTPLTTIRGTASATVDETTVAGARGVRSFRGTLEVAHALRRNLTLTAGLRLSDSAYQGVDIDEKGWGAFLRADYRLNRNVALRASYVYDTIRSNVPSSSYVSNVFLLGVRVTP